MSAYLIWSHEHDAWWGPAGAYTQDTAAAVRYSEPYARQVIAEGAQDWRKDQLPKEVIVPADSPDLEMAVVEETERMVAAKGDPS